MLRYIGVETRNKPAIAASQVVDNGQRLFAPSVACDEEGQPAVAYVAGDAVALAQMGEDGQWTKRRLKQSRDVTGPIVLTTGGGRCDLFWLSDEPLEEVTVNVAGQPRVPAGSFQISSLVHFVVTEGSTERRVIEELGIAEVYDGLAVVRSDPHGFVVLVTRKPRTQLITVSEVQAYSVSEDSGISKDYSMGYIGTDLPRCIQAAATAFGPVCAVEESLFNRKQSEIYVGFRRSGSWLQNPIPVLCRTGRGRLLPWAMTTVEPDGAVAVTWVSGKHELSLNLVEIPSGDITRYKVESPLALQGEPLKILSGAEGTIHVVTGDAEGRLIYGRFQVPEQDGR
ncbi:MAG: hypothetical protein R6V05_02425 [Candidatus Brocadiia bacterium]